MSGEADDGVVERELRRAVTSLSDSARWSGTDATEDEFAAYTLRSVSGRSRPSHFPSDGGGKSAASRSLGGLDEESDVDVDEWKTFERFVVVGIGDDTDTASEDGTGIYDAEVVCVWPRIERADALGGGDCGTEAVAMPDFPRFAFPEQVSVWKETNAQLEEQDGGDVSNDGGRRRSARRGGDTSFLFLLRVPGTSVSLWCVCVIVHSESLFGNELVDELVAGASGDGGGDDEEEEEEEDELDEEAAELQTSRCYCIVSKTPNFASHWRFLTRLIGLVRSRRASRAPKSNFEVLLQEYLYSGGGDEGEDDDGRNAASAAPVTPLPAPAGNDDEDCGDFGHILASDGEHSLSLQRHESSSLHFCVSTLCRHLSLDNILTMLAAVLCERSVIVLGGGGGGVVDIGTLTSAVLAVIPMMRPYEYQSVLMPYVPETMEDVMDAPVPFLLGVMHADSVTARLDADPSFDAVIVDVRNDRVVQSGADVPRLNDYDELRRKLADDHRLLRHEAGSSTGVKLWSLFGSWSSAASSAASSSSKANAQDKQATDGNANHTQNPFRLPEEDARSAARFCATVSSHLTAIARRAATYTITDVRQENRVSVLLEESFVASYASTGAGGGNSSGKRVDDSEFVQSFVNTQIWMDYYRGERAPAR